jgi:hypothetical protein
MVDVARDSSAPSSPATGPGPGQPAGSSSVSGAGNVMRLIAAIGSPIAIATGLLFYFGWVRASVQAKQLGYDTAILDWSVQDYILRSILVLFIPLMVLIGLMLLLTWLHQRLVLPMAEAGKLATWIPRALRGGWLLWIPAAIALSVVAAPLSGITVAIAVTVSLLCALYGDLLEHGSPVAHAHRRRPRPSSSCCSPSRPSGLLSGSPTSSAEHTRRRSPPILANS